MTGSLLSRRRLQVIMVGGVAALLVVGGWALWRGDSTGPSSGSFGATPDGPTFAQAFSAVNHSASNLSGGPWTLSQTFGIATPVPSSPSLWGWPGEYPETMNACQEAFNGLTIWNGTLPLFNGTFDSGTAPFWQFVFFSNQSGQLLVGTDVDGEITVFPPVAMTSPCATYSGLGYEPWISARMISDGLFPVNSPAMAKAAWGAVGKSWVDSLITQPTEMYLIGDHPFGSGASPVTQLEYFTCGTLGGVGVTKGLSVFTDPDDPSDVTAWENYSLGCTPTANNWTAIPVHLDFSGSTVTHAEGGTFYAGDFQVLTGFNSSDVSNQSLGIASWMLRLGLESSNGTILTLGTGGCENWTGPYTGCLPDAFGWYAVLLSATGQWLDCFGEKTAQGGWTLPVVPIVSGQSILLVVQNSLNLANSTLAISSTTAALPLSGNYSIQ